MELGKHSMETEEMETREELGLHTISHGFEKEIEETITKVFDGSLRSGKRLEFQGTIVIIGDVNAGAEVIAKEHVIVLGTVRGLVHAGAKGNRKAMVFANDIDAPQIRIADIVKEKEIPVTEEEEEEKIDKKEKSKKREAPELEYDDYFYDNVKTKAYIQGDEIILE